MTPQEEEFITKWNDRFSNDVQIQLVVTKDKHGQELSKFCRRLSRLVPKITVLEKRDAEIRNPFIQIGQRIRYHALPLGKELEPFLEAIRLVDQKNVSIEKSIQDQIDQIKIPAQLKLYIAEQCPFCPKMVLELLPMAVINEFITLTVIDVAFFPELAETDTIRSVPTLLLGEIFRLTGSTPLQDVIKILVNQDPSQLSVSSIENMLQEGNAAHIGRMMLDAQKIFPAFLDVLVHEKWPLRLAAMVAMEEIIEHDIELAAQAIEPLWERFYDIDDQAKGDVLYIFGECGNDKTLSKLESILTDQYNSELKEAAKEAIKSIQQRL